MAKLDPNKIYEWPVSTRILIIGLLCMVVLYLGYMWDLSSLKKGLFDSGQKEVELKSNLEIVFNKQVDFRNEISHSSRLIDVLNQWQSKMVKYSDLPELISEILKIGANNNLHFSLFDPGAEEKENRYIKVPIKVIVVGNYHQLANFMSQVANLPSIVVIGDYTISTETKNDVLGEKLAATAVAENLLTAEITLEVYHLAEENTK